MKLMFISLLCLLLLSATTCNKEGKDCHKTITIINNSNSKVIYSTIFYDAVNSTICRLSKGAELDPGDSYEARLRMCWEDEFEQRDFEFFIVDTLNFNENGFYDCDSIEYKNTNISEFVIIYILI